MNQIIPGVLATLLVAEALAAAVRNHNAYPRIRRRAAKTEASTAIERATREADRMNY